MAANQGPEISDSIPVHDLLFVLDSADMSMVDTVTMVVLDMADYFSDPDDTELTYTAMTTDTTFAKVTSVEGSVVTTMAVSSDSTFPHDTTMLTVTATDPDGASVSQETRVLVANSDYKPWDLIEINEEGQPVLVSLGVALTACTDVNNLPVGSNVYIAHWTAWQVKKGNGWVIIPGTYNELKVCPYDDLSSAPAGTYRLVGEVSIYPFGGDPEDAVRDRLKSGNDQVRTDN